MTVFYPIVAQTKKKLQQVDIPADHPGLVGQHVCQQSCPKGTVLYPLDQGLSTSIPVCQIFSYYFRKDPNKLSKLSSTGDNLGSSPTELSVVWEYCYWLDLFCASRVL